jgi:glycosyltransferase involved in cell wall biosynthesis
MIKTIIFHLGAERDGFALRRIWARERSRLAGIGLCHPNKHDKIGFFIESILQILHDTPELACSHTLLQHPAALQYRQYLEQCIQDISPVPHTLCLTFETCLRLLDTLPLWYCVVKDIFPGTQIKGFLSLVRQDITHETTMALWVLRGKVYEDYLHLNNSWNVPAHNYTDSLAKVFAVFGRENVDCFVADDSSEAPLLAQQAYWRAVGITLPPDGAGGIRCFASDLECSMPAAFWAFADTCNSLQFLSYYPEGSSPWKDQTTRFADWQPRFGLFSPRERAEWVAKLADSNAKAAKILGREKLFDPVDVNEPWEPFTGLTEESALRVAERLEKGFAEELLENFRRSGLQYLTFPQRLCFQALNTVCEGKKSPLISVGLNPAAKLSVLTLTYNHAAFIEENIKGVIAQQTDFPIQHIIADDASNDGTQDIILQYAEKYPHIVPIFQKTRTYTFGNIHTLFSMGRTEYVAICDGDDYFTDPGKLQTQVDFLDAHRDCALCFHPVRVTYEDDAERERIYPPVEELPRGVRLFYYLSDLIKCNLIQTNSVMYRWRFRDGLPDWFRPDLCPGDWYWHLLHAERGKIGFINRIMSVYRRHKAGVYYLSEVDRLKHRGILGVKELEAYDVINQHFGRKFESIVLCLTNGVFADCLQYGVRIDDKSIMEDLVEKYPYFAQHFLNSLKLVSKIPDETQT